MLSAHIISVSDRPDSQAITAVHAVHVLGGIAALGSILLRAWYPTESPSEIVKRRTIAQVVGWYWHFMGVLWLALFVLLGFWK